MYRVAVTFFLLALTTWPARVFSADNELSPEDKAAGWISAV